MKTKVFLMFVLVFGAAVLVGCSGEQQTATVDGEAPELAAQVGDWTFTRAELDEVLSRMSPTQKEKFDSPGGKVQLVERVIQEELYHQEALKEGMDELESVQKLVENYKRSILITEYFKKNVEPRANANEEELHDFYEANVEKYTTLPVVRAQHIMAKDRDKLLEFKKRIEAGEKLTTLAQKYSEDELTRDDGGDLGFFNPGGYIRGVGYSTEISDAAFSMEVGVVSDPIKWKKGWSLLRVNDSRPASLRPYEDVRAEISNMFTSQHIDRVKEEVYEEIKSGYEITNFMAEEMRLTERTPEELWNLAQTSSDSYHRLASYQKIVEVFPESKYAAQAQFMVGFVYAEELKDRVEADRAFTRVVNEYPDSEVAQTAKWMLDNLDQPMPQFEDLKDLNDKVTGESQ